MPRRLTSLLAVLVVALVGTSLIHAPGAQSSDAPAVVPAHDPTTLLVGFGAGTSPEVRHLAHATLGGRVASRIDGADIDVVRLPAGVTPVDASMAYEGLPGVAFAHPNWQVRLLANTNDVLYPQLWGLHNTGQRVLGTLGVGKADVDIDAPEGWTALGGAATAPASRVGILDTGIDQTHADLLFKTKACASAVVALGAVTPGCQDDNLHGTHVAGTVAASINNTAGVAGVAPSAELAVFKALNAAGSGFYADVIAGIYWLADPNRGGARIISMSLGGPQDDALDKALSAVSAKGVLLIAAAGNDGDSTKNYPAYHPDVVSVAAVNNRGERASFSNCNSDVELAAPGVDVWSTTPGNSYAPLNGTSMATPHVSGVAALVLPRLGSAADTRKQLQSTAVDFGSTGRDNCFGYGLVNLANALGGTSGGGSTTEPAPVTAGAISGKVTDQQSKNAIAGATVDCGAAGKATTGTDGTYALSSVSPGTYTCAASATGYRSKSQSVTVDSGQTTTANFALRKG